MSTPRGAGPGRPRDPALEANVLAAALVEYGRTGFTGFTMDGVARRAKVGKSSLYLRWPSKEKLLLDAIEAHSQPQHDVDTGCLRDDALTLATDLFVYFLDPIGWVTLRISVDAAVGAIDLEQFHDRITAAHGEVGHGLVERAVARGELPDGISVQAFVECLFGAVLIHTLALPSAERDQARLDAAAHVTPLVDFVLTSARAATS